MCVMQVSKRGRWTYRDWARWRFLWKFFPWYARELRYRGDFCIGQGCMHWFWEDSDKKERGYCLVAVSRTQSMMWAKELEEPGINKTQTDCPPSAAGRHAGPTLPGRGAPKIRSIGPGAMMPRANFADFRRALLEKNCTPRSRRSLVDDPEQVRGITFAVCGLAPFARRVSASPSRRGTRTINSRTAPASNASSKKVRNRSVRCR